MLERIIRWTLCGFLPILCSCTITVKKLPQNMKHVESDMQKQAVPLAASHAAFVSRVLGLTISGSASHLTGKYDTQTLKLQTVGIPNSRFGPQLSIRQTPDCGITSESAKASQALIDNLFAGLQPPAEVRNITVEMIFVPLNQNLSQETYAVRMGKSIDLKFAFTCNPTNKERSLFYGLLTSAHEITHILLHLEHLDIPGAVAGSNEQDERIAEGAAACMFRLVPSDSAEAKLINSISPDEYFGRSWELRNNHPLQNWVAWCGEWHATFVHHRTRIGVIGHIHQVGTRPTRLSGASPR